MVELRMHNARTGEPGPVIGQTTTEAELQDICSAAEQASEWLRRRSRADRRMILHLLAEGLETHSEELVRVADVETALGEVRLTGELARTTYQLRFMGEVVVEGSYLDVSIEHAGTIAIGPVPDLRKTSVPLGPIAVFGSSNFPFAFSAPGGDTASALAAGCPVIVKAHSSHPALSAMVNEIFSGVLGAYGAPDGVFAVVYGRESGRRLVEDPRIAGVGFTGSVAGGRELFNAASARAVPIPFYGELGSVNPFIVTPAAASERPLDIAAGLAGSVTQGLGQFCTKPGVLLVPSGRGGDRLVDELVRLVGGVSPGYLLNDNIATSYAAGVSSVSSVPGVSLLVGQPSPGRQVLPVLVGVDPETLVDDDTPSLREEVFGPFGVISRFEHIDQVAEVLGALSPALTGTLHVGAHGDPDASPITELLARQSGRVVLNGYPTGVAVSWGMNHGGSYPASTSRSTSVGADSIRRWIRPLTYQNAPDDLLPDELRDAHQGIPRRIDGRVVAA